MSALLRLLCLLVPVLLTISCAQKKLVPLGASGGEAVCISGSVKVSAGFGGWRGRPHDLDSYLTLFRLSFENRGGEPVELSYRDILLIDDRNRQLNALDPRLAVSAVAGAPRRGVVLEFVYGIPYLSLGFGSVYYGKGYGRDVVNLAFVPGRVAPGSRIRGFLYFQKLPEDTQELTLRVIYRTGGREEVCDLRFRVEKEDEEGGASDWSEEDW